MEERFYSIEEVADKLAVGEETVRDWLARGELKGMKVGGAWCVKHEDLQDFINTHNRTSATGTQGEYRPGF